MSEMLPGPRKIPDRELTQAERERPEGKFPDYIIPLRSRVKSPEQEALYRELLSECAELSTKLSVAYPEPWDYGWEKLSDICRIVENQLVSIASRARALGEHYNNFNVGALMIGYHIPEEGMEVDRKPWTILFDANTRQSTQIRKRCGELYLMDRIDPNMPEQHSPGEKMNKVVAFVVVGVPKQDDDSRLEHKTLTPCKLCRDRIWAMTNNGENDNSTISPETDVLTVDARDLKIREPLKVNRLHKLHGEKLPPGFASVD